MEVRLRLEEIGIIELHQQLDQLILARRLLSEAAQSLLPQLVDGSGPVHCPNDEIGRGRQAMNPARGVIVHDIPELAAVSVPMDDGVLAKLGPEVCNSVPRRAEKRGRRHGCSLTADASRPQAQPFEERVGPYPQGVARSRFDPGNSLHSRPQLWSAFQELRFDPKDVPIVLSRSRPA